jgi:AraC-like DNA-binding protein
MAGGSIDPAMPWDVPIDLPQGIKPFRRALVTDAGIGVLIERFEPNRLPEHSHPQWQIAISPGDGVCIVHWRDAGGQLVSKRLTGGQVWIVPPGRGHWVDLLVEGEVIVVYAHPARVHHLDALTAEVSTGLLSEYVSAEPMIAELCQELRQFCDRPSSLSPVRLAGTAKLLAVLVLDAEAALRESAVGPALGRAAEVVERVQTHINHSIRESLSVKALAEEIGICPRHFRRLFRRAKGMTPQEYLWSRRTAYAKTLLAGGRHNVSEAAAEAGFADQAHLNRRFRKVYGVAPGVFLPRTRPPQT